MPGRYRIRVNGRGDRALVWWIEQLIGLLRRMPGGWRAEVTLERDEEDDPPRRMRD